MNFAEWLMPVTEYVGIIAFAVSGAVVAIRHGMDVFGVVFLGIVTALGGGTVRDLLLGAVPPHFFTNYRALLLCTIVSLIVFLLEYYRHGTRQGRLWRRLERVTDLCDALGLAAFTLSGVQTAIETGFGDNGFMCVFLGMTTGIGGGILRDILTQSVPTVFRKRVYAVASILGGLLYWGTCRLWGHPEVFSPIAMALIVAIRVLAMIFRWSLPRIPDDRGSEEHTDKDKRTPHDADI